MASPAPNGQHVDIVNEVFDMIGPQPDLEVFSQGLAAAAEQGAKFRNIPAFAGGNIILTAINEMKDLVTAMHGDVQSIKTDVRKVQTDVQKVQTDVRKLQTDVEKVQADVRTTQTDVQAMRITLTNLEGKVTSLETSMKASGPNASARALNTTIAWSEQNSIVPLVNTKTGEEIPNFPSKPADIASMSTAAVNGVLTALDCEIQGLGLREKRDVLRVALGLKLA